MPDIPSAGESGLAGLNIAGWFGFYAPKGRAGGCHRQAQRGDGGGAGRSRGDLDVAAREQQTPAGLATFQTAEMDKWWPIIKAAGIRGE